MRSTWRRIWKAVCAALFSPLEGLSATKEIDQLVKGPSHMPAQRGRKGKRGTAPRKFKLQNTHLQGVDLSKDFVR